LGIVHQRHSSNGKIAFSAKISTRLGNERIKRATRKSKFQNMPDNEKEQLAKEAQEVRDEVLKRPTDIDFELVHGELEDEESSPPEFNLSTYPADFTLEILHQKWKDKEIEIPKFQRQFVWKQTQASKLIESFFLQLPVPSIFLYTDRKTQNFLVIDGQQRLKSVFYYFEGYFGQEVKGVRTAFRLHGLDKKSKFHNKLFSELEERDQKRLKNSVLRAFIVQQLDPEDDTSIYHIFERLNTGGTLLTNQEVRNCVYHGGLNDLMIKLNRLPEWRQILGKEPNDSRQKDIELMLRFFALRFNPTYEKPMKDFLSKFMKRWRHSEGQTIEQIEAAFTITCKQIIQHLGAKPFHVRAGLNSAVYDAVMLAFSLNLNSIPQDVRSRYHKLVYSSEFEKRTSGGTTDVESVKERIRLAKEKLFAPATNEAQAG
jgi:hypothetical protein